MKSTQAMRDQIRELVGRERDDYDRAVECVLDDLEDILTSAQTASVPPSPSYPETEDGPNTPDEALDLLMHEAGWTDMHGDDHHEDDCPICRSIAIVRAGLNHAYRPSAGVAQAAWECGARRQGTPGGNDPVDCDWPGCGCDPAANKFLEAIDEAGFEITKKREPLPWDAGSNYSYVPVETLAAEIYAGFVYDGPGNKPAWTPGGNGTKQDEARFEARRRLRAAGHTASTLSSTDPRCTCAAIVNPNIPHARSCPLYSTDRGGK